MATPPYTIVTTAYAGPYSRFHDIPSIGYLAVVSDTDFDLVGSTIFYLSNST